MSVFVYLCTSHQCVWQCWQWWVGRARSWLPVSDAASPGMTTSLCSYWDIHTREATVTDTYSKIPPSNCSHTGPSHTHTHTLLSQTHSLAPPQGCLHTLPPVPLVVVDEREGQGDVEGVGSAWRRRSFPRLKCDGEVNPGCRPPGFEALDEVLTEDLAQHGFEGQVYTDCAIRSTWERETTALETARNW